MSIQRASAKHSVETSNLADLLERVLDKGVVIAGDIKISLVDIELLTIQVRLVICSVEKAQEMGMDWWVNNPAFRSSPAVPQAQEEALGRLEQRLERIEAGMMQRAGDGRGELAAAVPIPCDPARIPGG